MGPFHFRSPPGSRWLAHSVGFRCSKRRRRGYNDDVAKHEAECRGDRGVHADYGGAGAHHFERDQGVRGMFNECGGFPFDVRRPMDSEAVTYLSDKDHEAFVRALDEPMPRVARSLLEGEFTWVD